MIAARFALVYLLTAMIDYAAFFAVYSSTGSILYAQLAGRIASVPFNYVAVRSKVFRSDVRHESAGPKFVVLYALAFFASWGLIVWMSAWLPVPEKARLIVSKMIAEGGILLVKFFVQKYWIFNPPSESLQSELG